MSAAPIDVACPNCQSPSGKPCTVPTDAGRRVVPWFHSARENDAAGIVLPSSAETLATTLLAATENDPTVTMLACECGGRDVLVGTETTVAEVVDLLNHAAFDHATRRDVDVYRTSTLLSGYELGALMRLDAQTGAEEEWRRERA